MLDDIQDLLAASPFRPFQVVTTDMHTAFAVTDPRQVSVPMSGETIHYRRPDGDTVIVAVRHVVAVTISPPRR